MRTVNALVPGPSEAAFIIASLSLLFSLPYSLFSLTFSSGCSVIFFCFLSFSTICRFVSPSFFICIYYIQERLHRTVIQPRDCAFWSSTRWPRRSILWSILVSYRIPLPGETSDGPLQVGRPPLGSPGRIWGSMRVRLSFDACPRRTPNTS